MGLINLNDLCHFLIGIAHLFPLFICRIWMGYSPSCLCLVLDSWLPSSILHCTCGVKRVGVTLNYNGSDNWIARGTCPKFIAFNWSSCVVQLCQGLVFEEEAFESFNLMKKSTFFLSFTLYRILWITLSSDPSLEREIIKLPLKKSPNNWHEIVAEDKQLRGRLVRVRVF